MHPKIKHLARNTSGRDLIVGDVHGEFRKLDALLAAVDFNPDRDRLLSVGDLVDRGPDSLQALQWLAKPWFHAVMGNHELLAIMAFMDDAQRPLHMVNGGEWFADLSRDKQRECVQAFARLPLAIELQTEGGVVGVVHGDVPDGMPWSIVKQRITEDSSDMHNVLLWGRDRITAVANGVPVADVPDLLRLFVGHTPVRQPTLAGNVMFIDGGACFGRCMFLLDTCAGALAAVLDATGRIHLPQPATEN